MINGSQDNSYKLALQKSKQDDRVKVYNLDKPSKVGSYNHAFYNSTGEIITIFACDDILHKDSLKIRSAPIFKDSNNFTTCSLLSISDNKKMDNVSFKSSYSSPNFSGGALMFHLNVAKKFSQYLKNCNEDTWTQINLRLFANHVNISDFLYFYRLHDNNSFGYDLSFEEKRAAYIKRMRAYKLFIQKHNEINSKGMDEIRNYWVNFEYLINKNYIKIFFQAVQQLGSN